MTDEPAAAPEARFAGSSANGGPQVIALYGGATETDRAKFPYEWLEFYGWGIRLRGRGLLARLVVARDIRYEDIAQLAVLIATIRLRSRGIRLQITGGSRYFYFFTRPDAIPRMVEQFRRHGVILNGQVTRTRIPYSFGYIYLENALVEPFIEQRPGPGL